MKTVTIRNITIGEGRPKICIPIVGRNRQDIINQAGSILDFPADIIEWRVDWFEGMTSAKQVSEILIELRQILGHQPLLMTCRTKAEGGEQSVSEEVYHELYTHAIATGCVDIIDVELMMSEKLVRQLVEETVKANVKIVMSNHDFQKTPSKEEIIHRLRRMDQLGADILKVAVMPENSRDVLKLLEATEDMKSITDKPVVTMAMGSLGLISRLSGEIFGSAMTFGSAGKASAPGQIDAGELNYILHILEYNEK